MLGAGAGRVESNRQYGGLRRAIAVSVAQAVLEAEGVDPSISLIVRNNFEDYPIHYQDYVGAAGLEDLAQVLDTNRAFPTIPPRTS
jgi:hypothetical protein